MFKNAMMYRITCPKTQAILNDWEELTSLLERKPAALPTGSQWRYLGFDLPVPSVSDMLVYSGPGSTTLFSLYIHERMLPGATIREHVHARCKKIEDRESRKCYAKERAQIRDEVEAELLPKAFIKHSFTPMMVIGDLLVIDTSSAKKAEDALSTLREALGSLPVRPVSYVGQVNSFLTNLLADNDFDGLRPGSKAKLADPEGGVVAVKDLDPESEEVQLPLSAGFKATELQMHLFNEQREHLLTFVLNDKLVFKGLKIPDANLGQAKTDADGDAAAYFDGSMVIFVDIIRQLIKVLDQAMEEVVYEKKDAYTPPVESSEEPDTDAYQSPSLNQAEQRAVVEEEEDDTFATEPAEDEDDEL